VGAAGERARGWAYIFMWRRNGRSVCAGVSGRVENRVARTIAIALRGMAWWAGLVVYVVLTLLVCTNEVGGG
jgi:hypothetical protein